MAERLVHTAIGLRSGDNISVVVLRLAASSDVTDSASSDVTGGISSTDAAIAAGLTGACVGGSLLVDESLGGDVSRVDFDSPSQGQVTPDMFNMSAETSGAAGGEAGFNIQREVDRMLLTGAGSLERRDSPSPTAQTCEYRTAVGWWWWCMGCCQLWMIEIPVWWRDG